MTDKSKRAIVDGGAIGYNAETILMLVDDEDLEELKKQSEDRDSEFWRLHAKGEVKNQYLIDQKLLEMAQSGDLKAIQKMEQRRAALKRVKS